MKKSLLSILTVIILSATVWNSTANAGRRLFDDFSFDYLDSSKWGQREYVRYIENGTFVSKLGNGTQMSAEIYPGFFVNNLPFIDSDYIHTIQADITVVEARLDRQASDATSVARIVGYFYNVNEVEGLAGEIFARIEIGDRGNGLEAFWSVEKALANDSTQWDRIGSGTINLTSPLQFNVPAIVKISYDGNKTFDFSVNGQRATFVGLDEKRRGPEISLKALEVGVVATDGSDTGYVSAEFDNVYINNSSVVYDDFSAAKIDSSKWQWSEWVREVANGHLQSTYSRADSMGQVSTYLSTEDASYFEATARIESGTSLSDGASCMAGVQGYYYNERRGPGSGNDYNVYEGNVSAAVSLQYWSDGSLKALVYVGRSDTSDKSSWTTLLSHTFALPISLDTDYTLSIRYMNNTLIFSCDDETVTYEITTPTYAPYFEHRGLKSQLWLDQGESGYLKTQFDNVYIEGVNAIPAINFLLLN